MSVALRRPARRRPFDPRLPLTSLLALLLTVLLSLVALPSTSDAQPDAISRDNAATLGLPNLAVRTCNRAAPRRPGEPRIAYIYLNGMLGTPSGALENEGQLGRLLCSASTPSGGLLRQGDVLVTSYRAGIEQRIVDAGWTVRGSIRGVTLPEVFATAPVIPHALGLAAEGLALHKLRTELLLQPAITAFDDADVQATAAQIEAYLRGGYRVVLVAHSLGNPIAQRATHILRSRYEGASVTERCVAALSLGAPEYAWPPLAYLRGAVTAERAAGRVDMISWVMQVPWTAPSAGSTARAPSLRPGAEALFAPYDVVDVTSGVREPLGRFNLLSLAPKAELHPFVQYLVGGMEGWMSEHLRAARRAVTGGECGWVEPERGERKKVGALTGSWENAIGNGQFDLGVGPLPNGQIAVIVRRRTNTSLIEAHSLFFTPDQVAKWQQEWAALPPIVEGERLPETPIVHERYGTLVRRIEADKFWVEFLSMHPTPMGAPVPDVVLMDGAMAREYRKALADAWATAVHVSAEIARNAIYRPTDVDVPASARSENRAPTLPAQPLAPEVEAAKGTAMRESTLDAFVALARAQLAADPVQRVRLTCVVSAQGEVEGGRCTVTGGDARAQQALDAVTPGWRFTPATKDMRAVRQYVSIPLAVVSGNTRWATRYLESVGEAAGTTP